MQCTFVPSENSTRHIMLESEEINDPSLGKTFIYVHLSQQAVTGAICLKDIDDARGMK